MRLSACLPLAVACAAQVVLCAAQGTNGNAPLRIPPVKATLNLQGQPIQVTSWGAVSGAVAGTFRVEVTVDLSGFQENLTPVLRSLLDRSDRCGERLSVQRARLAPSAPLGVLTAYVHYERFGCVKAFGKEIVKRLVAGDGVVEVQLTPSVEGNTVLLAAQVRKIDADGSLGELLRSGSLGDSLREKIAASIQSAIQKSTDLKSTLPAGIANVALIQSAQFADGGAGQLWLTIAGEVRLSPEQFRAVAKGLAR